MLTEDRGGDGDAPDVAKGADEGPYGRRGRLVRFHKQYLASGQQRIEHEARTATRDHLEDDPFRIRGVFIEQAEEAKTNCADGEA